MLLGRFFCGFICPVGALVDFADRWVRSHKRRPPRYLQRLKYVLLVALALLAAAGVLVPLFMDPISLLTRIVALVVEPAGRLFAAAGQEVGNGLRTAVQTPGLPARRVQAPAMLGGLGALALLAVIVGGGFWDRRFWCQYVCPSGALFGLLSRFSLLHRQTVAAACNLCRYCATHQCPTRAIDEKDPSRTSPSECVRCGLCAASKRGCSRFLLGRPPSAKTLSVDLSRRHFLVGVAAGAAGAPVIGADGLRASNDGRLVRPPGAVPEAVFRRPCITCGQCINACPEHAAVPDSPVRIPETVD